MFQTEVLEEIKTHFVFENRAVYEIMWENIVERGRPELTIWRMRLVRCITTANTRSQCAIRAAFPLQQWLQKRGSLLRYTYVACPVEHLIAAQQDC
jgi:hypothetical protein